MRVINQDLVNMDTTRRTVVCPCRIWHVQPYDKIIEDSSDFPKENYTIDHSCYNLTVYRLKKTIKRLYFKKTYDETETTKEHTDNAGGEIQGDFDVIIADVLPEVDIDTEIS